MRLRKGFGAWSELIEKLKYKLICLRNAFLDSIAKEEIKIHREELDSTLKACRLSGKVRMPSRAEPLGTYDSR
jgi:hypothetical protein